MLPPGQFEIEEMPRFGLPEFADRFPERPHDTKLNIFGNVKNELELPNIFKQLRRIKQTSDFHCVTTWSVRDLQWEGVLFRDFYEKIVCPQAVPDKDVAFCETRSQDKYRSCLPLKDLLQDNVLIADRLNGEPLSIAHGAPIRLVAPDHYGYKNAKHVSGFGFYTTNRRPKKSLYRLITHARGRVAFEERSTGIPGWLVRHFNRLLINGARKQFQDALEKYENENPR